MSAELTGGRFESLLDPLGWLLYRLRVALDEGLPDRPPRWLRIAAAAALPPDHPSYLTAKAACTAWIELVSALHELVLDLIELLDPITADRQAMERTLRNIHGLLGQPVLRATFGKYIPEFNVTLDGLQRPLELLIRGVDLMPDREDALALGNQIYALLCVKPAPAPERPLSWSVPASVDLDGTGRLRLLQWAFDLPWPLHGVGTETAPEARTVQVRRLGARWLWEGPNEAQSPVGWASWADGMGARSNRAFELLFNEAEERIDGRTEDLTSLHHLLETLGYFAGPVEDELRKTFHPALSQGLEVFQAMHGLPRTRMLDADTLNQLLHLDSRAMTVRRAQPLDPEAWAPVEPPPPLPARIVLQSEDREFDVTLYEATPFVGGSHGRLPLVNPEADTPHEEGISPGRSSLHVPGASMAQLATGISYAWYVAGAPIHDGRANLPPGVLRGWIRHEGESIRDEESGIGPGVTAIQRRIALSEGYDGGVSTEGGTSSGDFFFAARHQVPSMAGRTAHPASRLWSPPRLSPGAMTGIYQWIDLSGLRGVCGRDRTVTLRGRVAVRVGVSPSGAGARGRLVLALVPRRLWAVDGYRSRVQTEWLWRIVETDWFPSEAELGAMRTMSARGPAGRAALASRWVIRQTDDLEVPLASDPFVLYVGLHGESGGGEDIEAYFDKLAVEWVRTDIAEEGP